MTGAVHVVTASAGTGKTHRLGTEVEQAIADWEVEPEAILAVTFTRDAARQLMERTRARLFQVGLRSPAQRLLGARIGTVHSVFGGLLADYALEAGRSPLAQVVAEGAGSALFRVAADTAIGRHAAQLNPLARRFGHDATRADWREMVREVVDLARQNGLHATAILASAEASWQGLAAALEPAGIDGTSMDAALARALAAALNQLPGGDTTGKTATVVETLREAQLALEEGELSWPLWAKLAKLDPGVASVAAVQPVIDAAALHGQHPQLRADLEAFIRGVFACAGDACDAWQGFKAARGLVDFSDQEAAAFEMLASPAVAARLQEEAALLLVDEFQDTSPMQLALFLRVAALLPRSLWVGDPKQAIYGFRGTDPDLMQAVTAALPTRTGGTRDSLTDMRRSRPALVRFVNDIFGDAFLPAVPRDQVVVKEWRPEQSGLSPALGLWRLHGRSSASAANALASGVAAMLADRAAWPVPYWDGRAPGPLRGSDIAVLCRSNDSAREVAEALAAAGLKVALGRGGLLGRAECVMALARLRWLADSSDTAALAELAHLAEGDAEAPAWLNATLTASDPHSALAKHVPGLAALEALRDRLDALTPAEALDAAVAALGVPVRLRAWGDATSRLANLEALRALALVYEEECTQGGLPATAAGLCAWLAAAEAEEPASPDPDAVRVMTVHKAKGREWPVVVVADLDSEPKGRLFDKPVAMPCAGALDPMDPLVGRWIRLWPWPYAKQVKDTGLDARAEATPTGIADAAQAQREAVRLLYVALTRARDWLILAPRVKAATKKEPARLQTRWLDILGDLAPRLPLAEELAIRVGELHHACSVLDLTAPDEAAASCEAAQFAPVLPIAPIVAVPRLIRPSALTAGASPVMTPVTLGPRLPFTGTPDMAAVGEAVHGFFAADRPDAPPVLREALAARLLRSWGVAALSPADVVKSADRLWGWLALRWPGCNWRTEVPVFQRIGMQRLSGRVDLVVEHPEGLVVLDHKTFPGRLDDWASRAAAHLPQLRAYAGALESATGRPVTGLVLHLPVAGVVHAVGVS
jgi:ATP-dependent helicase/nuclease subunit A